MKDNTKKVGWGMQETYGRQWIVEHMYRILAKGKEGLDTVMKDKAGW